MVPWPDLTQLSLTGQILSSLSKIILDFFHQCVSQAQMQQNLKLNPSLINNSVRFQIKRSIAYGGNDAERPANPLEGNFLYQKTCQEDKRYGWWCSVRSDSDPTDCSPRSSVHGISQARILKWAAISFSRGSSWPRDRTQVSYIGKLFTSDWHLNPDKTHSLPTEITTPGFRT